MYFQLHCQYPSGHVEMKKITTTWQRAKEWAEEMNRIYPEIQHWVSEVLYESMENRNGNSRSS